MCSRSATSLLENAGRTRRTTRRRSGLPSMSAKQTQAYLIARDALRRIQRTSSLLADPGNPGPKQGERSEQLHRSDGSKS